MFGREKYSKGNYEAAEAQSEGAKKAAEDNPGSNQRTGEYDYKWDYARGESIPDRPKYKWVSSVQEDQYEKTKKKLENLLTAGHKEALELDGKHNKLVEAAMKAQEDLDKFEKEELGM